MADEQRNPLDGLTGAEVDARVARGDTNAYAAPTSRRLADIVSANVFTLFNAILGVLLVVVLVFGSWKDALFGIVLVLNAAIGIVQELRAKAVLDRLSLHGAPRARVVRDGELREVAFAEIVRDDVVELRAGDQVPADGGVLSADGLEVDESLLTGESVPVAKDVGGQTLSGTSVVAGSGRFRAEKVGAEAYAARLGSQARRFKLTRSELRDGINSILAAVAWVIVPVGALLLFSQLRAMPEVGPGVVSTAAGMVGMVPEGLVLLTSVALAASVIALGRRRVLVQELPAVEGLARVDVICLDKTGTLTEGSLAFGGLEPLGPADDAEAALGALAADPATRNATLEVLSAALPEPSGWMRTASVAFRSDRKWSAASFEGRGTWVLGAPEVLASAEPALGDAATRAAALAADGSRVLLLAHSEAALTSDALPRPLAAAALVLLAESVRADAAETLRFFREQGVAVKIISGDSPVTVGAIARRAGLADAGAPIDARALPAGDAEGMRDALRASSVFGRVTPAQKRDMVEALQADGHVVAMTGDGVNDILAVKAADIGVAMGSGAAATRAVAPVVLLDNDFSAMPGVVAEGRRVIANTERVANLFVTKTVYAVLIAVAVALTGLAYPFLPRHLTLVGSLTIGIPGFFLSLAPNPRRYVPGFVKRVVRFTIPAGAIAGVATLTAYAGSLRAAATSPAAASSAAVICLGVVGLIVLALLARPYAPWKMALVGSMALGLVLAFAVPFARTFFALEVPPTGVLAGVAMLDAAAAVGIALIWRRVESL